jgi:hypothetical protein
MANVRNLRKVNLLAVHESSGPGQLKDQTLIYHYHWFFLEDFDRMTQYRIEMVGPLDLETGCSLAF